MPNHFVLAFEAFAAWAAGTAGYGTEMRAVGGVHVCVGAGYLLVMYLF